MSDPSERRKRRGEAGETLAELLVTISIIGLAVVVLVGALATAIKASTTHREHSTADTMVRSIAEAFKNPDTDAASNPDVYVDCATSYPTTTVVMTGYTASQTITYWKGTGSAHEVSDFVPSCNTPANDKGLQLVKITVKSDSPKAESDTVSILKRRVRAP